jgi:hypothetical protein
VLDEPAPIFIQKGNIYAIPILHYTVECAAEVVRSFAYVQPDCIAAELPYELQDLCIHAASRLPDVSAVEMRFSDEAEPLYYPCEPCDASFEALRIGIEHGLPVYAVDMAISGYPMEGGNLLPDSYAIAKIGLKDYYEAYLNYGKEDVLPIDHQRELAMAKRLKELSLSYDKVLFVCGMSHLLRILKLVDEKQFPEQKASKIASKRLVTYTEESAREVMAQYGYLSCQYEAWRVKFLQESSLSSAHISRYHLLLHLFKEAAKRYVEETGNRFLGYNLRNLVKFSCNYALVTGKLLPNLYQILSSAKGCVDHNYAYYVWEVATTYPFLRNIDSLPEEKLSIESIWGSSKTIRFHLKEKNRKAFERRRKKGREAYQFTPPFLYGICSYQPEDGIIENFGDFVKKRGQQLLSDESMRVLPFSSSLEEGIDAKETIRHWFEKKLYVKVKGKPSGAVGNVVVIFDDDLSEKFPWRASWHGEHAQESDMGFYATAIGSQLVGPGISRCQYGGFMLSYPPRRLADIWQDSDYEICQNKAELLLMAAIDYAIAPNVVYVAEKPPRSALKNFAARFGKKVVYLPLSQFSPVTLNKLRIFHVLDGHHRRAIADEYIT